MISVISVVPVSSVTLCIPEAAVSAVKPRDRRRTFPPVARTGNRGWRGVLDLVTRCQRGFTYLAVLFIVATITAGLALIGEMWETAAKREKEAELLFIGDQYRKANGRYYESTPGAAKH